MEILFVYVYTPTKFTRCMRFLRFEKCAQTLCYELFFCLPFSLQEMYSKGLIPISAVKQVRALGENKFEVVTSVRTFVFRAEKEGEPLCYSVYLMFRPPLH